MKRVGELMQEIGFRENASDSVKAAFIKNLVRTAHGKDVQIPASLIQTEITQNNTPASDAPQTKVQAAEGPQQLAFNLAIGE